MTRSPISAPDILDKSPTPLQAIACATDETLWALIRLLIAGKVIDGDELIRGLQSVIGELQKTGPIQSQEDKDRFSTLLALQRVEKAIGELG